MTEERLIYIGLAVICGPVFALSVEPAARTIAGLLAVAGILGFVRSFGAAKLPKAKARHR